MLTFLKKCVKNSSQHIRRGRCSISRLIFGLRGGVLSTNWSFHELKTLVEEMVAENKQIAASKSGESLNQSRIKGIEFLGGSGEAEIIVKLTNETEILLEITSHTCLN